MIYDRFSDDVLYSIQIARQRRDPRAPSGFSFDGSASIRYDFRFSQVTANLRDYKNLNTILSYGEGNGAGPIMDVGDAHQNFTQTYTVRKFTAKGDDLVGGRPAGPFMVPPPNVGQRMAGVCQQDVCRVADNIVHPGTPAGRDLLERIPHAQALA